MPPKRTPVKGAKDATPKSKKDKRPRVIVPEVIARPRDSSVESTAPSAPTGISPDFLAYIQMLDK